MPLEEMVKTAIIHSNDHGMALSSDENNLLGALAAVLSFLAEHDRHEDKARLEHELKLLRGLSAATHGVPVDFASLFSEYGDDAPKPVGIHGLWREHTAKKS